MREGIRKQEGRYYCLAARGGPFPALFRERERDRPCRNKQRMTTTPLTWSTQRETAALRWRVEALLYPGQGLHREDVSKLRQSRTIPRIPAHDWPDLPPSHHCQVLSRQTYLPTQLRCLGEPEPGIIDARP
jgi:hypothetical protein